VGWARKQSGIQNLDWQLRRLQSHERGPEAPRTPTRSDRHGRHQSVGCPIEPWSSPAISSPTLARALSAIPNVTIHEGKAFVCNIEKALSGSRYA